MNIEYRLLTADDVEKYKNDLVYMLNETLKDNIPQDYPENLPLDYVTKMPGYIEDGSAIIVGAFDGDKLVGFLWGYEMDVFGERRVHTTENHVIKDYRNNGISAQMLRLLEEETKKRGIYILEAMCTASNENAYNYHVYNGYKVERYKFKKELNK